MRPWRPANGTEGDAFEAAFCARCERASAPPDACTILEAAFGNDIGDKGYPSEWIEDESGPRCIAFEPAPEVPTAFEKSLKEHLAEIRENCAHAPGEE